MTRIEHRAIETIQKHPRWDMGKGGKDLGSRGRGKGKKKGGRWREGSREKPQPCSLALWSRALAVFHTLSVAVAVSVAARPECDTKSLSMRQFRPTFTSFLLHDPLIPRPERSGGCGVCRRASSTASAATAGSWRRASPACRALQPLQMLLAGAALHAYARVKIALVWAVVAAVEAGVERGRRQFPRQRALQHSLQLQQLPI
jgi:hypothetical protein